MDNEKLFSDQRWNDKSLPKVIGHRELTEKEKKEAREILDKYINKKRKNNTDINKNNST